MKESTVQAFEFAFTIFLLLSALVYMVFYTTETIPAFNEVRSANETVFMKNAEIPKKVNWTGAQVVGKLYRLNENDIAISVNSLHFKNDADVLNFVSAIDRLSEYEAKYNFDANGKLTHIQFTTIN